MFAVAATTGMAPGIVGLFIESGWMGKVIMGILLVFSILSWAMILLKFQFLQTRGKGVVLLPLVLSEDQERRRAPEARRDA